jgi:hypothetical protein
MVLSVRKLSFCFDKTINGVVVVANRGLPTEQRWALGPWCAIDGGAALVKYGSKLLRKQLFADDVPTEVEEDRETVDQREKDGTLRYDA